ncbi:MAG: hypothetical protein H0U39_02100 [Segetibacter sp.]|nr:hypothetical protein [Segetibacter sp.]
MSERTPVVFIKFLFEHLVLGLPEKVNCGALPGALKQCVWARRMVVALPHGMQKSSQEAEYQFILKGVVL